MNADSRKEFERSVADWWDSTKKLLAAKPLPQVRWFDASRGWTPLVIKSDNTIIIAPDINEDGYKIYRSHVPVPSFLVKKTLCGLFAGLKMIEERK